MSDEKKVTLWCTTCQRGVGGSPQESVLKIGDYCPWCAEKQEMMGQHADFSRVCLLRSTDEVADEDRRFSDVAKQQAKVIRGQETHNDIRQKLKAEFDAKSADQDAKIAELTAKLEAVVSAKSKVATSSTK